MEKTILIVDEDIELCNALGTYLNRKGYETTVALNGQDAVSTIEKNNSDIILSGTLLKDMTGLDLLRHIKQKYPEIEVIMMTEQGDPDFGIKSLQCKASDFIFKPINNDALDIAITRARNRISLNLKLKDDLEKIETLHKNSIAYQQLFDEVPCYISIQDKNFRLTETNRLFKQDFGHDIGSYCYKVYKHRTEPCLNCPVQDTFRDGKPHHTEEIVTSKSGEQYNVFTWTSPIRNASGNIIQVMEVSTNITQIRKLQDHLSALGLLMGSMSHGMRGLLTGMDGGLYSLEIGLKNDNRKKIEDAAKVLKEVAGRIKKMVLDILYYTKERKLNAQRVNILKFSNSLADAVRAKAMQHDVKFICKFDKCTGEFEIDPDSLNPALINILDNSIDACLDDKSYDKAHKVILETKVEDNCVVFIITDNGIGIDTETREKMFTLFFTSKGYRGTGLGLFVANQVVRQHGGSINVESTPGQGSCFTIKLPATQCRTDD